ncbi:hypothetical protein [Bradyrhizobium prioriisuperbiae]|uniref:hypothetical protein n=1 Tax=Bradyrhizobium prioriisuperbiae TaxID=2854389 RepID=UPI0028E22AA2|nr:hypothetical protein [Bradyrhizobium prioritasuperba]
MLIGLSVVTVPAQAQPLQAQSPQVQSSQAQSLKVTGYAGFAGEWELTATVTEKSPGRIREYAGPLTMTHTGLCTQDGPEQKTGEMRLQMSTPASSRVNATLVLAGVECTYSGKMADFYTGTMTCADRQTVPLKLWIK